MAIHGINPLESDNAEIEFGSIVFSIIRRVNHYISGPTEPKVVENSVLGDLYALLCLCKCEKRAGQKMAKGQVGEWREAFLKWVDAPERRIPKKYFEGYRETACQIFEELEGYAAKKPRDFWHKKAHPQGMS